MSEKPVVSHRFFGGMMWFGQALLLCACVSDSTQYVPPPAEPEDYECAANGDLNCVRVLAPQVQDCIIEHVDQQLSVCTQRCESQAAATHNCGGICNSNEKDYIRSGVAKCRPADSYSKSQ